MFIRPRAWVRLFTAVLFLVFSAILSHSGEAASLVVRVVDAGTGLPLAGAFVQVGPGPGNPFADNWGWTGADGTLRFRHPDLTGPQTVTAGQHGYTLLTLIEVAADSVRLALHSQVADPTLPPPKAEIRGRADNIEVTENDGHLDVGFVYPTIGLSQILLRKALPIEVPADTVNLPMFGETVLPGNVVLPEQTERGFLDFSKPYYRFFVPDDDAYDFLVLSGRIPLSSFNAPDLLNRLVMRGIGVERVERIQGNRLLRIRNDLALSRSLEVSVLEAPAGSDVYVAAVGDLSLGGQPRSLFFDGKHALRDSLGTFLLSGLNPAGDLLDVIPYIAGYYADSSAAESWQSGRVDRTPLRLPARRELGRFFAVPDLLQEGAEFAWSDVARPGTTVPTWALSTFRLAPIVTGDSTVTPQTAWELWARVERGRLELPLLAPGAPGGLPDPGRTPQADRLMWDLWIADPQGPLDGIAANPFLTLSRWSQRSVEITPLPVTTEWTIGGFPEPSLRFRLAPNPGRNPRDLVWDRPLLAGTKVTWTIWDAAGRRKGGGAFTASGSHWERRAMGDLSRLPAGVYLLRIRAGEDQGTEPIVIVR